MRRTALVPVLSLLAAACASAPRPVPRSDSARLACERGDAPSCTRLGLGVLTGFRGDQNDRGAAAWYMAGCDLGDAQACADLGALYVAGVGVRKDDGRACDLGLAQACARLGREAPEHARTPGIIAIPGLDSGFEAKRDPEAVADAMEWVEANVPAEDRRALALTPLAIAKDPPAGREDLELFQPVIRARQQQLARCVGADNTEARGVATFRVERDGRTSAIRAKVTGGQGAQGDAALCVVDTISRWEFPTPWLGGRVVMRLGGPTRSYLRTPVENGFANPREKTPGCIAREVYAASRELGFRPEPVAVKFAVMPDGTKSRTTFLSHAPPYLAHAITEALDVCDFDPGIDPDGTPVPVWVTMPFTFN
jgi:hypothetical protein